MTDYKQVEVRRGDDDIPRDRFGRYLLPHPETGKTQAWTRATTIAGTLKDRFALEKWDQRNIVYGLGQRPALYAKAASATLDDVKTLSDVADRAREAADSQAGADIGSAVHTFAERIDRGEDVKIPPPYDRDIDAYYRAMKLGGVDTALGWIERVVCVPQLLHPDAGVYGVCGQLDRLVVSEWPQPRIGDIKTATDKVYGDSKKLTNTVLTYGMVDIPLQLAIYAHAECWWDPQSEQWCEMPHVDQDRAMVMHIPAGLGECRIYEIDIAAGWEAIRIALDLKRWRKRKDLAELVVSVSADGDSDVRSAASDGEDGTSNRFGTVSGKGGEVQTPADDPPASPSPSATRPLLCRECTEIEDPAPWCDCQPEETCKGPCRRRAHASDNCPRFEWCRERVNAIKAHERARSRLAGLWSLRDEIPTFPKGGPRTDDELSAVIGMCDLVEMEFELPFGPPDPAAEPIGRSQSDKRRDEVEQREAEKARKMRAAQARKATKA